MLLGPVFRSELIRTARRRRYYVLRVVYGLVLLQLIWGNYYSLEMITAIRGGRPTLGDLAQLALRMFLEFAVVQLATILVLVPALFGGVIADEKQRKTLHYLMASRLSSGEIVLDKLLARLLHVGVFVLLGLPVVCLIGLFGGLPWEYVAVAYTGSCAVTLFTAAMATLVSTLARRVRHAVLVAYLLEVAWLIGPALVGPSCRIVFPTLYAWFGPINEWLLMSSPAWFLSGYLRLSPWPTRGGPAALLGPLLWMVGLQCAGAVLLLIVAVARLRPTFRRQEASPRRVAWFGPRPRRARWLARPDCGGDAMLWKERHFARTDVFTKLVVLPATIVLTVGLILGGQLDESVASAAADVFRQGYTSDATWSRQRLNTTLRVLSPIYIGLWLLAVAGASASSVAVEREEDTWTSLVSTPLTGLEILRGKLVGSVWGLRGFGGLLALFWLVGLAAGAIHPLGVVLASALVAFITGFVAALGTRLSLTARSTSRALAATIAIVVVLNVGVPVLLNPVLRVLGLPTGWDVAAIVCTPGLASVALLSYGDVRSIIAAVRSPGQVGLPPMFLVALMLLVLAAYGVAAVLLARSALRRFDAMADRPRRGGDPATSRPGLLKPALPDQTIVRRPALAASSDLSSGGGPHD